MTTANTIGKCSRCGFTTPADDSRIGTSCEQRVQIEVMNPKTGQYEKKAVRCDGVVTRQRKV